jgi:hypothetical protein
LVGTDPRFERGNDQAVAGGRGGDDAAHVEEMGGVTDGLASGPVVVGDVAGGQADVGEAAGVAQVEDR